MSLNTGFLALLVEYVLLSLVPKPCPGFHRLQYGKAVLFLCVGRAWKRGFVVYTCMEATIQKTIEVPMSLL